MRFPVIAIRRFGLRHGGTGFCHTLREVNVVAVAPIVMLRIGLFRFFARSERSGGEQRKATIHDVPQQCGGSFHLVGEVKIIG